jgi:hypothetical protein
MSWVTPPTWTTGQVPTASDLNDLSGDLQYILDNASPPSWIQFGTTDPVGSSGIPPLAAGNVYQNTATGTYYTGLNTSSTGWVCIGGSQPIFTALSTQIAAGLSMDPSGEVYVLFVGGFVSDFVVISDVLSQATGGLKNGLYVTGNGSSTEVTIQTGSSGQYTGILQDPTGNRTVPGKVTCLNTQTRSITSGALSTTSLTSGTSHQVSTVRDMHVVVPITFNPSAGDATCLVQISPDNSTFSTLLTKTVKSESGIDGTVMAARLEVPVNWYIKLTVTHATLGTVTYY